MALEGPRSEKNSTEQLPTIRRKKDGEETFGAIEKPEKLVFASPLTPSNIHVQTSFIEPEPTMSPKQKQVLVAPKIDPLSNFRKSPKQYRALVVTSPITPLESQCSLPKGVMPAPRPHNSRQKQKPKLLSSKSMDRTFIFKTIQSEIREDCDQSILVVHSNTAMLQQQPDLAECFQNDAQMNKV